MHVDGETIIVLWEIVTQEYSRILIENYCYEHNSAKSRRLWKLVRMSCDLGAEGTESDAIFLEKVIEQEKDLNLKEALQDLDEYLFGY